MDDAPDLGVAYVAENCYICRKYQTAMKAFIIIIGIFILMMVIPAFFSDEVESKPTPKRSTRRKDPSSPKSLPWFDKDYLKRKKKEKNKYFWDD